MNVYLSVSSLTLYLLFQFDVTLSSTCEMYRMMRDKDSIDQIRVIELKNGTFERLKSKIITDTQNQQYKLQRVIRNKDHLQFLLSNQI